MTLLDYLWSRLLALDQTDVFGVPGDFAIPLFVGLERRGAHIVSMTHEPSVGYAADAYARCRGFGTALVTYGPGALNVVNAVAQAYAERTPLLLISGAPSTYAQRRDLLLHHRIRDFDSQLRIFREVTCAAAVLNDPLLAAHDIDLVLRRMREESRPGYLEIPTDMADVALEHWSIPVETNPPATSASEEVLEQLVQRVSAAKNPLVLAGVEVVRFGLRPALVRFVERWNLPCMNTMLAKAALSDRHPNCVGTFQGAVGDEVTVEAMRGADLVLSLGTVDTDVNLGLYTLAPGDDQRIVLRLNVSRGDDDLRRILPALAAAAVPRDFRWKPPRPPMDLDRGRFDTESVVQVVNDVVGPTEAIVTVDVGDIMFAASRLRIDDVLSPCYYGSTGFAVPAALAAELATGRRAIALVGDGAFQMTGVEIATALRYGLRPIVVILDNDGYETLRTLDEPRNFYATSRWDYAALARALGVDGIAVCSQSGLGDALRAALADDRPAVIEASLETRPSRTLQQLRGVRAPALATTPLRS